MSDLSFGPGASSGRLWTPPESVPVRQFVEPLSEDEDRLIRRLQSQVESERAEMREANLYFTGQQPLRPLGISVPKALAGLRTVTGWARVPVMPQVERIELDGFRFEGQTDADEGLMAAWRDSGADGAFASALVDMLVMGRTYVWVGSPLSEGGTPTIRFESPLNTIAAVDERTGETVAAVSSWTSEDDVVHAEVALPSQTIRAHLDVEAGGSWIADDRDHHGLGVVPVVPLVNMKRSDSPGGSSEIVPELRTIIDAGCRTLQQMQVAGEFYSTPKLAVLGMTAEDFEKSNGSSDSLYQSYISRLMTFERDGDGNVPEIWQAKPYDPSVFTEVLNFLAAQAASICRAPAQDFGLYTQGNPISADAMHVSESGRDRRARMIQRSLSPGLRRVMRFVSMFANGGVPDDRRIEVDWVDPQMFSLAGASDALQKQVASGSVAPRSDVVLKRLGYSAVERVRLAADFEDDRAEQLLAEIGSNLEAQTFANNNAVDADEQRARMTPEENAGGDAQA